MSHLKMNDDSLRHGAVVRKIVDRYIKQKLGDSRKRVALLLSAGLDSTIVGLSAHLLGHKVHAYTFRLKDEPSIDSRWAERTAEKMGWKWTLIELPKDVNSVIRDWPVMYRNLHCRRKRDFECTWPFLYVYPRIEEKFVLTGLQADAHFALNRKSVKLGATVAGGKPVFDKIRRDYFAPFFRDGHKALGPHFTMSCAFQHRILQKAYGLVEVNPFLEKDLYNFLLRFDWLQLNKPRQKHFFAGAYPREIKLVGHRNHVNYQLGAGVDHFFESLLSTPLNFNGRRRTIDMFGDWSRYDSAAERVVERIEAKLGKKVRTLKRSNTRD